MRRVTRSPRRINKKDWIDEGSPRLKPGITRSCCAEGYPSFRPSDRCCLCAGWMREWGLMSVMPPPCRPGSVFLTLLKSVHPSAQTATPRINLRCINHCFSFPEKTPEESDRCATPLKTGLILINRVGLFTTFCSLFTPRTSTFLINNVLNPGPWAGVTQHSCHSW